MRVHSDKGTEQRSSALLILACCLHFILTLKEHCLKSVAKDRADHYKQTCCRRLWIRLLGQGICSDGNDCS